MHRPHSAALRVERVVPKDNYETPAHLWRHAVATFRLDRDAHASSLNAVLPSYDTRDAAGPQQGARYWLNPAFGAHLLFAGSLPLGSLSLCPRAVRVRERRST